MHLAFGLNRRHTTSNGSTMLALSENYRVPEVLRRIADAYLALWSSDPAADWIPAAEPGIGGGGDYDIIATGEKTLWLCELGDASSYSDYESFKTAIKSASLQADAISFTHGYSYLKLNFSTATRELSDSAP
jgi:hypothetical protein